MEDDDQDSLFGSPPPSPRFEGRAASPALALPSAARTNTGSSSASNTTSAAVSIQNVGTIALPGSQPDSEIPIHPLALSLNHGMVPRPPALPQQQSQTIAASTSAARSNCTHDPDSAIAGPSRSSATAPPTSRGTGSSGKAKRKSRPSQRFQSEPVAEHATEFLLPDPSAPPPLHFLRSQENLLGKAGRVGGITVPQHRGSTPSNPILIDDDEDTPMIGRRSSSKSRNTSQTPVDPMKLAQPTNEEIVSVLVGQKDIFPVLENILKLIAKGAQPTPPSRPSGFERRPPGSLPRQSPPAKKRKLNRVPAGASDWDVPFPFAEGEGPTAYQQNWERDRGKRLISELIKLIKVAARKAAAKKFIAGHSRGSQQPGGEMDPYPSRNVKGYYRPETALYGLQAEIAAGSKGGSPSQLGAIPSSQANQPSPPTSLQPTLPPSSSQQDFRQLLLSIMVENSQAATEVCQPTTSAPLPTDKETLDAWKYFLEAFPANFDGTGSVSQGLSGDTTPLSVQSTSGIDDLGLMPGAQDFDTIFSSIMETPASMITTSSAYVGDNSHSGDPFSSSLFDFTSIRPNPQAVDQPSSRSFELNDFVSDQIPTGDEPVNPPFPVSFSTDSTGFVNQNSGIRGDLTQASSPLPSTSSESQAVTPASSDWDLAFPGIFTGSNGEEEGQGVVAMDVDAGIFESGLNVDFSNLRPSVVDKGKAKEVVEPSTTMEIVETASQMDAVTHPASNDFLGMKTRDEGVSDSASTLSTLAVASSTKRRNEKELERLRRKEDIIRRAKERRQEIQEDLNNTKRQLWETTVEQAALIQLTKRLEAEALSTGIGLSAS